MRKNESSLLQQAEILKEVSSYVCMICAYENKWVGKFSFLCTFCMRLFLWIMERSFMVVQWYPCIYAWLFYTNSATVVLR